MYPFSQNSCDKINNYILNLLSNLNEIIKLTDGIIDELLMSEKFNKNSDFLKFILQFKKSLFISFKCEGYLEYLVLTKYYTCPLLRYLINEIKLITDNLDAASKYLDNIKTVSYAANNADFQKLLSQVKNILIIANALPEVINLYKLPD